MNLLDLYVSANEYNSQILDKFERVPAFLSNNENVLEPTLSKKLQEEGFIPKYPEGKKYAVCFSHDIDFLYETKNSNSFAISLAQSLKRGQFKKSIYNARSIFKPLPFDNWSLDKLIDLELKRGIVSTYYFLCLQKGEQDHNYDISEVSKYFDQLVDSGFEIGLHGGHRAYCDKDKLAAEKSILENHFSGKVKGYRNHYLRFQTPATWHILKEAGFVYDTTYGYAEQPGYRNGMCYPFRPYDKNLKKFIDIIEIPLVAMDVSFFKYLNLSLESAINLFDRIHNSIKNVNGVLTILWHNNCLDEEYGLFYNKILDVICNDENAWITTSLELAEYWKEHNLDNMEAVLKKVINYE